MEGLSGFGSVSVWALAVFSSDVSRISESAAAALAPSDQPGGGGGAGAGTEEAVLGILGTKRPVPRLLPTALLSSLGGSGLGPLGTPEPVPGHTPEAVGLLRVRPVLEPRGLGLCGGPLPSRATFQQLDMHRLEGPPLLPWANLPSWARAPRGPVLSSGSAPRPTAGFQGPERQGLWVPQPSGHQASAQAQVWKPTRERASRAGPAGGLSSQRRPG